MTRILVLNCFDSAMRLFANFRKKGPVGCKTSPSTTTIMVSIQKPIPTIIHSRERFAIMPIKGIKPCGAKCRTKGGAPCLQPGMQNGRCKMHGGVFYKRETHGGTTLRAIRQRKQERALLKEMKEINAEIEKFDEK